MLSLADRREEDAFPFRARFAIVRARVKHVSTWHELWTDLIYLVRG